MQKQGLFTEREIEELFINILPVLDYVHSQKIVHRDIKPDNIIIRHRDNKPVLIDFGAVRESMTTMLNSQGSPTSSIVIGTPGFMSSEQAAGRPVYSSDLYSLGLTAIYLLTGKQPQTLETDPQTGEIIWRHFASAIPPHLAGVIDKSIAYHPRERFSSAREMLNALQNQFYSSSTIQNQEITPTQQPTIPPTINITKPVINNKPKNIIIGSLIIVSLTGAAIITQILNTSLETVKEAEISISTKRTNPTNEQQEISSEYKISKSVVRPKPTTINNPEIKTSSVQETKTTNNTENTENNYFWLSQRQVTEADLVGKSGYELDIMRNTIFAVHGRRFDTPGLQDYFNQQSWYNPQYSTQEFPVSLLSKFEIENAKFINQYQERNNLRYFK
ncbi:MAG: hypothetical protein RLZZ507_668 [Cyanobacteriota bacterium]|jgi:serine/threonine-protein kinase